MRFVAILLLAAAPLFLKGQGKTYIGIVGGGHAASAFIEHTLYITGLQSRIITQYHGGVMLKHYNKYNPNFKLNTGIQTGLMFSRKGWKQDFILHPDLTTTLDYGVLPIDAIIYAGNEKRKVFALLGVFGEYLINSSTPEITDPDLVLIGEDFFTYSPSRDPSFGYGFNGGLGLQWDIGIGAIHLNGFFNYSLSNFLLNERPADQIPDVSNLWNVGGSIGYFLRLN